MRMGALETSTWFATLNPVVQAALAGGFTWFVTMLGAATVLLRKSMPQALLDGMLGFAAGVMIAASFWSLLAPAIAFRVWIRLATFMVMATELR